MVLKESAYTCSAGRMMLYGFPLKEIEFVLKKKKSMTEDRSN